MKRAQKAELYLEAARRIADGRRMRDHIGRMEERHRGCCIALAALVDEGAPDLSEDFGAAFAPRGYRWAEPYWMASEEGDAVQRLSGIEMRQRRLTALCLAAAMARTGDL